MRKMPPPVENVPLHIKILAILYVIALVAFVSWFIQ